MPHSRKTSAKKSKSKSKSKSRLNLKRSFFGGALKGEGGFGCVFDLDDLRPLELTLLDNDGNPLSNMSMDTSMVFIGSNKKVAKLFASQDAFFDEIHHLHMLRKNLRPTRLFASIFPQFYEHGFVRVPKPSRIRDSVVTRNMVRCSHFKNDYGIAYFIVMDKLDMSLREVLIDKDMGVFQPITQFVDSFRDLFDRLGKLHLNGYVHCDIKPDNIMVDKNGKLFFTDVGHTKRKEDVLDINHLRHVSTRGYTVPVHKTLSDDIIDKLVVELDSCSRILLELAIGSENISQHLARFKIALARSREQDTLDMAAFVDNFAMAVTAAEFYAYYVFKHGHSEKEARPILDLIRKILTYAGKFNLFSITPQRVWPASSDHQVGPRTICQRRSNLVGKNAKSLERAARNDANYADMFAALGL